MVFKKGELKCLWPFYLYQMLYGMSTMIFPFLVLYFMGKDFSYFQVSVITAAQGLAMFLFEIPTGAFADRFSRKYSMVLGFFIVGTAAVLIPFTSNFYVTVLLWSCTGIGLTFSSGSEEALVIDNLNKEGRQDLHHEYFIKSNSFIKLGSVFAPIIGALLVKTYSMDILWLIFGGGYFINAVIIMVFANEHYQPVKLPPVELIKSSYKTSKMGIAYVLRHKVIFFSVLCGLFTSFMMVSNLGMQPLLVSLGMEEHQLGYLYSVTAAVNIGMSFLSRRFIDSNPYNLMSVVVVVVMVLLLSLLLVYPPYFYIACFIFIMRDGMFNFGMPIFYTHLHKFIPKKIRATTLSAKSMADQLVIACAYLGAGSLMDFFGPQKTLAFGGLFGIIVIILYQKLNSYTAGRSIVKHEQPKVSIEPA